MPNTHGRRRRDETVSSRLVGGVYTNSQLVGDSFVVSSVWTHTRRQSWTGSRPTAALCVRIAESVGSRREFMYTPPTPTRRDKTVSSRRRCVLGLRQAISEITLKNSKQAHLSMARMISVWLVSSDITSFPHSVYSGQWGKWIWKCH